MAGFLFGAGTPYRSHADLKKARGTADNLTALAMQGANAQTLPEGLMGFGTGIAAALMKGKANRAERVGKADYNNRFTSLTKSLLSGGRNAAAPSSGISASVSPTSVATPKAGKAAMGLIEYANQSAIRNDPLSAELTAALDSVLPELGVTVKVFSGGQEASGPSRTGSKRHDHGNAADVFFYKDGRRLDWRNPNDIPLFQEIVRRGKAAGLTGFGAGEGYMQPGSMHIGFGNPGVWGAGGRGVNAPGWLRAAFNDGSASPAMASAPQAAPMGNGMQIMPVSAPVNQQMAAPQPQGSMTAFQRAEMARLGNEVGIPSQQRDARQAAIMGQGGAVQPMSAQAGGGGFFTGLLPQGSAPEQMAQVQQAEAGLEAMPIEEIAELASSPFAEPWQQNLMQQYLQHRMEQQFAPPPDPMEQRRKELELQKLEQSVDEGIARNDALADPKSYAPIPYDMGNGQIGYGIPMEDGSFRPVQVPEGAQFLSPYEKAFQTNAGATRGKTVTEQELSASSDIAASDQALDLIRQIERHTYIDRGTGLSSLGNVVWGTGGIDFQNLVDQAKSGAFLTAIDQLRGMGALSNMEGQTATAAVTRINTATSKEAFLKALDDYRKIVEAGRERALRRSQGGQPQAGPDLMPAPQSGGYDLGFEQLPENVQVEGEDGNVYMKRNGRLWRKSPNNDWEAVQ